MKTTHDSSILDCKLYTVSESRLFTGWAGFESLAVRHFPSVLMLRGGALV